MMLLDELKPHLNGEVFQIDTYYAKSSPCYDCRYCWTNDECIIKDEMQGAYEMMDDADNIVVASPIYYGNLTGSILNWASRLQYLWASRRIRKVEPLSEKYRKGVIVLVHGLECNIKPAVFAGKDLLLKTHAECCEVLELFVHEADNKPIPTNENTQHMRYLANLLNTR
jgi:multimeric flavodoxin WrbA